jgi:hypothetical protein
MNIAPEGASTGASRVGIVFAQLYNNGWWIPLGQNRVIWEEEQTHARFTKIGECSVAPMLLGLCNDE